MLLQATFQLNLTYHAKITNLIIKGKYSVTQ